MRGGSATGILTRDGEQKQRSATNFVDTERCCNRNDQVEDRLTGAECELLVLVRDSGASVDSVHVIGE